MLLKLRQFLFWASFVQSTRVKNRNESASRRYYFENNYKEGLDDPHSFLNSSSPFHLQHIETLQ